MDEQFRFGNADVLYDFNYGKQQPVEISQRYGKSKKRFNDDGYDRHKVFIYKEDFNKFIHTLEEVVDHIKNNLMPEYDFDEFTRDPEDITYDGSDHSSDEHDDYYNEERTADSSAKDSNESVSQISSNNSSDDEEVMKWD